MTMQTATGSLTMVLAMKFFTKVGRRDSRSGDKVVEAMKEHRQMTEPSSISPSKLKKMFNKMRPSIDAAGMQGDELIPAFASEIKSEHEEELIDQRDVHDRHVRNFGSKLDNVYTLLCYIYHLRTRDLRTRFPLSRDFLKALKTEVLTDQKGRPLRHTRVMSHAQPQSRGAQRSSTDTTVSRMEHDYHMSPHMNTRSSFVIRDSPSLFRSGITGTGAIESRASFLGRKLRTRDTTDKIDTWEDLLEAGDKPSQSQAPWTGTTRGGPAGELGARGGVTRTSFLHSVKMVYGGARMRRYGILHHAQNAAAAGHGTELQLPLWHQVAAAEKHAKENGAKGTFPKRRIKKSSSKIESSLSDMISEGFVTIQAKSAERVRTKLNKVNRKENESFIKKVLAFNPTSLYKVDLQRVRQAGREVSEDYDKEDVKTARWYGDLEQEAQELGVAKEPEVINLLNKLYPFAIDDIKTLPFVQAKLCLVIQSLPVYELCSLTMLDALKFLLVRILNGSSGTFNEWMNQRKLLPGDKA
ncbi:hypothetical protein OS493_036890 [Desmophyllum pertusum]|uniref:Uncharacterized protein n=1 Tax=Desmophyllum pertusum TaxID=174260 RepID=A0A9X0CH63_9CNID|nr:hypothetical protein OS493_036890 [Desmophyllum pertusum]